jgi:hypothetical protein
MTSTSSPAFHGEGGDIPLTEQPAVEHIMSPADEHSKQHSDVTVTKDETAVESSIKFSPPLYKQRYDCVSAILRQEQVISVSI